jgi:pimeloyl-ACP methyl ester carboxylesterase
MGIKQMSGSSDIVSGTVTGIDYYHCAGKKKHLVLLHGAKFTKENWKTIGILGKFCQYSELSVSAMDLPVSAGHEDLQALLTSMEEAGLLTTPVVVVTPSASGKTITDWIKNGDVTTLKSFVSLWIPVAAGSVASVSEEQLIGLGNALPIFAIYGNRDVMGQQTTERLANLAGAETLEIEGGHPCYLDSPDDFVSAILQKLNVES